jgi:hypothetical protein
MPHPFFTTMRLFSKKFAVVLAIASVCLFSTPVLAGFQAIGFQWVAPPEPSAPYPTPNAPTSAPIEMAPLTPGAPGAQPIPPAGQKPEVISPIVIQGQPSPPPSAPSSPPPPSASLPSPSSGMGESSLGVLPAPPSSEAVVQGFANNVPLAVALRQMLPPGYGFSIDQDVDLGTLVSFKGGQSWRETLQAMLQPVNLSMREEGQMISIGQAQAVVAPAPPSPQIVATAPMAPQPMNAAAPMVSSPAIAPPPPAIKPMWPGANPNGPKPQVSQPTLPPLQLGASSLPNEPSGSISAVDTWNATRGESLHKVLEKWSQHAGVELEWLAEYDYPLQGSVSFNGTFEDSVRGLLAGFEDAHPQPVASLHANPGAGQLVLVIETRGNSYSD